MIARTFVAVMLITSVFSLANYVSAHETASVSSNSITVTIECCGVDPWYDWFAQDDAIECYNNQLDAINDLADLMGMEVEAAPYTMTCVYVYEDIEIDGVKWDAYWSCCIVGEVTLSW